MSGRLRRRVAGSVVLRSVGSCSVASGSAPGLLSPGLPPAARCSAAEGTATSLRDVPVVRALRLDEEVVWLRGIGGPW